MLIVLILVPIEGVAYNVAVMICIIQQWKEGVLGLV